MTKSDDDFHAALREAGWACRNQEPDPDGIPVWQLGTVWGCHEGSQPYESLRRVYESGVRKGMEVPADDAWALAQDVAAKHERIRELEDYLSNIATEATAALHDVYTVEAAPEEIGENSRGEGRRS